MFGGSALLATTSSRAQALKNFSPEQMTYLGRLGNAYSTARNCNYSLDADAIRRQGAQAFGEQPAPASQGLDVAWSVNGFSALADEMIFGGAKNTSARKVECAKMLKLYGPGGSVIDGAVKP